MPRTKKLKAPFSPKVWEVLVKQKIEPKTWEDVKLALLVAKEMKKVSEKDVARFLVWAREKPYLLDMLTLAWKIVKANNGKIPKTVEELLEVGKKVRTRGGKVPVETSVLEAGAILGVEGAAKEIWIKEYERYRKEIENALGRRPETWKDVVEGARKAGLKVSEGTLLNVAYEVFGIKEAAAEAWRKSMKEYGEKIEEALGRKPKTLEEVREGARKAGLELSEETLINVAHEMFGIKTGSRLWKKYGLKYGEKIEKALGKEPKTLVDIYEGAKKAGLDHLSEETLLSVAHRVYGIEGASTLNWIKRKYPKWIWDTYDYFKKGGKLPLKGAHRVAIVNGAALYVRRHLLGKMSEEKIRNILRKRRFPEEMIEEILRLAKG